MSDKDERDLRWGLNLGADMIALSFVRSAKDIEDVHRIMDEEGIRLPVIAKIEKPQAVENLEEIVDAFDAIMVARGDLGVELPLWDVPLVQKRLLSWRVAGQARDRGDSDARVDDQQARPTRAEASDVANAVLDGADAVMLSGETASAHPVEAVRTMAQIVETVEEHGLARIPPLTTRPQRRVAPSLVPRPKWPSCSVRQYVVDVHPDWRFGQAHGTTAYANPAPRFHPGRHTRRRLSLTWGVEAFLVPEVFHTDDMVLQVDRMLRVGPVPDGRARHHRGRVAAGDPGLDQRTPRARDRRRGRWVCAGLPRLIALAVSPSQDSQSEGSDCGPPRACARRR